MKEVLKLALEALEELNSTNSYWWQEVDEETLAKIDPAITAIKEALAQPEQKPVEDVVAYHSDGTRTVRIAPKRPWVGLTDDDMPTKELDAFCRGARWADSKLKDKNT